MKPAAACHVKAPAGGCVRCSSTADMTTTAWASGYSSLKLRSTCAVMPGGVQFLEAPEGAAGEGQHRFARRQVVDTHVAPENAAAESRAQRLGTGFLGRIALGILRRGVEAAVGTGALGFGVYAGQETLAEAR